MAYKAVRVSKGRGGWGGPLIIKPQPGKDLIYCVTGGGIHPVAQRIADLTGGKVFDGFRSSAPENQIACVVIDCGGTARIGVYPMKRLLTVDVKPSSPSGPLIKFIKEDIFVSGVRPEDISVVE
jgi:PTS system glucitol/sorbitol-specific IIB component/PTS system glucitol/sorbitol-specific IIC component